MNEGTWDLSVFYQDFDDPALRGDIDAIRAAAEGMENLLAQDRPEADRLEAMVSCLEDMTNRLTRAYGYAELTLAADTENEGALRLMDELSALMVEVQLCQSRCVRHVGGVRGLDQLIEGREALRENGFILREMARYTALPLAAKPNAGLPDPQSLLAHFRLVTKLLRTGAAVAAYTPGMGGPAEAVMKMAFGNGFGFDFDEKVTMEDLFGYAYGSFVLGLDGHEPVGKMLGTIRPDSRFVWHGESVNGVALQKAYEEKLEPVYSCNIPDAQVPVETVSFQAQTRVCPAAKTGRPKVLIPVFPGTNCEYDSAKAMIDAGAEAEIFVIRNLTAAAIAQSVEEFAGKLKQTQMVFLPGGFSGGDEPDGSAKFITAFFRNAAIKEAITALLEERDGLMLGICNGFQALIKLGLLPYGKILDTDADCPTLTYNTIGRHQSRLVRTRVASNLSPWLSGTQVGEVYTVPISHGASWQRKPW